MPPFSEPTFSEIDQEVLETGIPEEKPSKVDLPSEWQSFFKDDQEKVEALYGEWKEIWLTWPEDYREHFLPLIKEGHLKPSVYEWIKPTFQVHEEDATYMAGGKEKKYAASFDPEKRTIGLYPRLKQYNNEFAGHILTHELGHAASFMIDPEEYAKHVAYRLERGQWTNGKYIQSVGAESPSRLLCEMVADDVSDFFRSATPADMLKRRLARAGTEKDMETHLAALTEEDRDALREETERLFSFFQGMFNPDRQKHEATKLTRSYDEDWFPWLARGFDELIDPPDIGQEYWEPTPVTHRSASPLSQPDPMSRLIADLFGVTL